MGWDLISELRQLSNDLTTKPLADAVKGKHPAILDAAAQRIYELQDREPAKPKRSSTLIELLHIGGVMDGKWHHVKGQFSSYPASGASGFEPHHYRRETMAAPDGAFDVMIYSAATTGWALSMLIQGYRPLMTGESQSKPPFSGGQHVVCNNAAGSVGQLHKGTIYTVVRCVLEGRLGRFSVELIGVADMWSAERFSLV